MAWLTCTRHTHTQAYHDRESCRKQVTLTGCCIRAKVGAHPRNSQLDNTTYTERLPSHLCRVRAGIKACRLDCGPTLPQVIDRIRRAVMAEFSLSQLHLTAPTFVTREATICLPSRPAPR